MLSSIINTNTKSRVYCAFKNQKCCKIEQPLYIVFLPGLWIFTDADQPNGDDLTLDEYDDLYCPACDKSFKSDKAWVLPWALHPSPYLSLRAMNNSVISFITGMLVSRLRMHQFIPSIVRLILSIVANKSVALKWLILRWIIGGWKPPFKTF